MDNDISGRLEILETMLRVRISRQPIVDLASDEVFVFGTDPEGKHRSSAARLAVEKFGAKFGVSDGLSGRSYAIPVHKFKTGTMASAVNRFLNFAAEHPQLRFHVLPVGCGAAGMDPAFVALMFRKAIDIPNVFLCEHFIVELKRYYTIGVEISADCKTIVRFPRDFKGEYKIPLGVECIGSSAFMGCCGCDLHLPDSIRRIEKWAFCDMGVLGRSLFIPKTVDFIDDKAFESEWFSPKMAVCYNSYAYHWAKTHNQQYDCVDFDEVADIKRRVSEVSCGREVNDGAVIYLVGNSSRKREDLIIGRDWVFVRTADGRLKFVCGEADDDFILKVCGWRNVVQAAAGFDEVFAVLSSGELICASTRERCRNCSSLHGVRSVVACEGRFVAVKSDGSVVSLSDQTGYEKPFDYDGQLEVICRNGVKKVAVGWLHAAVLDNEGRVTVVGEKEYCNAGAVDDWRDVVDIDVFGCYYSCIQTVGLRADGTVCHTLDCPEIDSWRDIVSASCLGDRGVVGLDRSGRVLLAGDMPEVSEILKSWPPMVAVRANFFTVVGIDRDGRIWCIR